METTDLMLQLNLWNNGALEFTVTVKISKPCDLEEIGQIMSIGCMN